MKGNVDDIDPDDIAPDSVDKNHKEDEKGRKTKAMPKDVSAIDELQGKLRISHETQKLMHSILENDKETIDSAKLLRNSMDQGFGAFNPDLMMEQFVSNYNLAKQIYGESLIRHLSGYDASYVERNVRIPEFKTELRKNIDNKLRQLRRRNLLNAQNEITEQGIELASVILYIEAIDDLMPKGILGEKLHHKTHIYGDKGGVKIFRRSDRYRDIALKSSVKTAVCRGHDNLMEGDLKSFERQAKGKIYLIYALDSSGSMKGEKIAICKKAGVALAFKAIEQKDNVGVIVFGKDVQKVVMPTDDFSILLKEISAIKAGSETNLTDTIKKSIEMFPNFDATKHLMLITDAQPTVGEKPEDETLEAAGIAAALGITISVVGIDLDKNGEKLARKIVEVGKGRLYIVKDLKEMDRIVLWEYYCIS